MSLFPSSSDFSGRIPISVIFIEFWEDESEERNRASFPRWGKLRVISYHFFELVLEITEMGMRSFPKDILRFMGIFAILFFEGQKNARKGKSRNEVSLF
jgi:hypothetical protein